jgi:hypothetical protein
MRTASGRDVNVIAAAGVVVAAAPVVWYPLVWSDPSRGATSAGGWVLLFAFSVAPFWLVAFLRATGRMRRVAGIVAAVIVAALVVLGQIAGLNPNDPSSTASIALVTTPIGAGFVALAIWGVDRAVQAVGALLRTRRRR